MQCEHFTLTLLLSPQLDFLFGPTYNTPGLLLAVLGEPHGWGSNPGLLWIVCSTHLSNFCLKPELGEGWGIPEAARQVHFSGGGSSTSICLLPDAQHTIGNCYLCPETLDACGCFTASLPEAPQPLGQTQVLALSRAGLACPRAIPGAPCLHHQPQVLQC